MASSDARPFPLKNTAYRVTFPILDADGDLVTGATGLDSEVSKDGGTFADCTSEATEIATNSGVYYLDLTSTEMNADTAAIIIKTSTSGAKTTVIVLYPVEATDIPANVTAWNGTAVATPATAGYPAVTIKDGTGTGEIDTSSGKVLLADGAITAAVIATGAIDADAIADNAIDAGAIATGAITSAKFASGAINAAALATDAVDEIVQAVWNEDMEGNLTPGTAGAFLDAAASDPWGTIMTDYTEADTAGKILNDLAAAGGSSPEAIAAAVWEEAAGDHVDAGTTGLALAYARDGSSLYGSPAAANNLKKAFNGETYNASGLTVGAAGTVAGTVNAKIVGLGDSPEDFEALQALAQATVVGVVVSGTNTTTVVSTALDKTATNFYVPKTFVALTGANARQGGKTVVAYDGATKRLTIEALTSPMSPGDRFALVG